MSETSSPHYFVEMHGEHKLVNDALLNMSRQLQSLSTQADTKANIVITVGTLALTISLGGWNEHVLRPSIVVLGIGSLVGLTLAVLTVVPTYRTKVPEKINPLFFAHVAGTERDDFLRQLAAITHEDHLLIEALAKDIWSQSFYLITQKYRFLRAAYFALLGGFLGAGGALMVATILGVKNPAP